MKQLPNRFVPAIDQTQFKCDFCTKVLVSEKRMGKHEDYCYYNPTRHCGELGCNETGLTEGKPCWRCEIAEKCGGKSYI